MIDGIYVRIALVALLLGVGTFGGCRWQKAIDRPVIERKDAALQKSSQALADSATAMRGFAVRFQDINAATAENMRKAAAEQAAAAAAVAAAQKEQQASKARVQTLEQKLLAEREGCVDGRRPICGLPLR